MELTRTCFVPVVERELYARYGRTRKRNELDSDALERALPGRTAESDDPRAVGAHYYSTIPFWLSCPSYFPGIGLAPLLFEPYHPLSRLSFFLDTLPTPHTI